MGGGIVAPRADWGSVLEAVYSPIQDEQRWAEAVHAAAKASVFRSSHGAGFSIISHGPAGERADFDAIAMDLVPQRLIASAGTLAGLGVEGVRRYFYPSGLMATHLEIERGVPPEQAAYGKATRAAVGVTDAVGVFSYPTPGRVATLYAMHDAPIVLSHHERSLLARLALHIDAALRLRKTPERVCAILDANGKFLHRVDADPALDGLPLRVARVASQPSMLDLWSALVAGTYTLVRRREGGRIFYYVLENPPGAGSLRALTAGEEAAVRQAAAGLPTKLVSYALGVSSGVVSDRLASAAAKLGAASRKELLRIAAMLTRDPRAAFPVVDLTEAEREILALLQQGLSNDEIARHRSRSLRTIANQVASLLRKTNSSSRRALLVSNRPGA